MFWTDSESNSNAVNEAIKAQISKFREILLSVDRCDRQRAEHHVRKLYEGVGLPAPRYFAWLRSPAAGAIAISMLRDGAGASAYHEVAYTSRERVSILAKKKCESNSSASAQFWRRVHDQLTYGPINLRHANVSDSLRIAVGRYMLGSAWESIGWFAPHGVSGPAGWIADEMLEQIPSAYVLSPLYAYPPPPEQLWRSGNISDFAQGCYDAPRLQFYDFCKGSGMDLPLIEHLVEIAKNCAWWFPRRDICIMTERPQMIGIDRAGRLHREEGPCIKFRDDWMAYALHGEWLAPRVVAFARSPNAAQIEQERNVEFRRRMLEMFGVENYVRSANAVRLQEDECGTLLRKDLPGDEPIMMVQVTNSTPEPDGHYKQYFLRVPPTVRSAREGVAWTFGLSPLTYKPIRQT